MSVYNTRTHLGAFLCRENHFRPNGLVGFMAIDELELIDAYADASGKHKTIRDKILTVNGCLATPDDWLAFDPEWQVYLKDAGFRRVPRITEEKYVFHASPFWADDCDLMPKSLKGDTQAKTELYRGLIKIICDHRKAIFGYGVLRSDFIRFEKDFPGIHLLIGDPAYFLSSLCIGVNSSWSAQNDYNSSLGYTFDQGDDFPKVRRKFMEIVAKHGTENLTASGVRLENKVYYSPLQAADIVTWECKRYWSDRFFDPIKQFAPRLLPGPHLTALSSHAKSADDNMVRLFGYEHIHAEVIEHWRDFTELSPEREAELIGEGKPFSTIDDHIRACLHNVKVGRDAEQQKRREAALARKGIKL